MSNDHIPLHGYLSLNSGTNHMGEPTLFHNVGACLFIHRFGKTICLLRQHNHTKVQSFLLAWRANGSSLEVGIKPSTFRYTTHTQKKRAAISNWKWSISQSKYQNLHNKFFESASLQISMDIWSKSPPFPCSSACHWMLQELSDEEEGCHIDLRSVGSISCGSVITSLLSSHGKLFVGSADRTVKVCMYSALNQVIFCFD